MHHNYYTHQRNAGTAMHKTLTIVSMPLSAQNKCVIRARKSSSVSSRLRLAACPADRASKSTLRRGMIHSCYDGN